MSHGLNFFLHALQRCCCRRCKLLLLPPCSLFFLPCFGPVALGGAFSSGLIASVRHIAAITSSFIFKVVAAFPDEIGHSTVRESGDLEGEERVVGFLGFFFGVHQPRLSPANALCPFDSFRGGREDAASDTTAISCRSICSGCSEDIERSRAVESTDASFFFGKVQSSCSQVVMRCTHPAGPKEEIGIDGSNSSVRWGAREV